jgi:hypothetical protein
MDGQTEEVNMSKDQENALLGSPAEILNGMNAYIEGKMKRYNLLFAVNGGAFAIAKLYGDPNTQKVLGGLTPKALAIGAIIFTAIMWRDIYVFGKMMRDKFFGGEYVFRREGQIILGLLSSLLIAGWLLAAFYPKSS